MGGNEPGSASRSRAAWARFKSALFTSTETAASLLPTDSSADATLRSIMTALIETYGSLAEPRYDKIYVTMNGPVHRNLIAELRRNGMDVLETTDENDDVSTQLDVSQSGDWVSLDLSGVGPFAALVHQGEDEQYSWVTTPDQGPTPLAKVVAALVEQAGFLLLTRDIVTRTIKMTCLDESTEATLYQVLFTDTDWIP